jgi:hypothetical protein
MNIFRAHKEFNAERERRKPTQRRLRHFYDYSLQKSSMWEGGAGLNLGSGHVALGKV